MKRTFRDGSIGALMDEYERAALGLKKLVVSLSEDEFVEILDSETADEDCRSAQTILSHVIGAGYAYADYLRKLFAIDAARPASRLYARPEALSELDAMLGYTAFTLEDRWAMTDDEITGSIIRTSWGVTYDIEQLFEHAIVHILRHRRQIEKLLHLRNLNADDERG
jgi:uncharacterized damage-inducible protein DinB